MRSFLPAFAVAALIGGFASGASAAPFLGYEKAPGDPNPSYPPQYYQEFNSHGPGWMNMAGASDSKSSMQGYDKAPGDPNPNYPPDYTRTMNTKNKGWMSMGGDK